MEGTAMKALMILGFILAAFVTPVQAQTGQSGSVSFNGNIFDAPASQAQAQPTPTPRTVRHVRKYHRVHSPS